LEKASSSLQRATVLGPREDKIGRLVHKPGGTNGATWIFDYDENRLDDDEAGYRFDAHRFARGEYVTVRDQNRTHTFGVSSVEDAGAA